METETISKNEASLKNQMSRSNTMRRTFLFFATLCVSVASTFAQDVITLKNGEDIQVLVQEIGAVDVKYKKIDNPNGPNYTLKKSEILIIRYASGSKDIFSEGEKTVSTNTNFILKKSSKVVIEPYVFTKKAGRLLEKKMKKIGFCCVYNKGYGINDPTANIRIVIYLNGAKTFRFCISDKTSDSEVFDKTYENWISLSNVVNNFIKDITPFVE